MDFSLDLSHGDSLNFSFDPSMGGSLDDSMDIDTDDDNTERVHLMMNGQLGKMDVDVDSELYSKLQGSLEPLPVEIDNARSASTRNRTKFCPVITGSTQCFIPNLYDNPKPLNRKKKAKREKETVRNVHAQ